MNSIFCRRTTVALLAPLVLIAVVAVPRHASAQNRPAARQQITVPMVGTAPGGETLTGTFTVASFAVQDGQVVARGLITGIVTNAAGVVTSVVTAVAIPITVAQTTCAILHLDLGPIFLDVLGLQVDLSRIVLDITAQAGAGNLLGNLLCAVVGLLDDPTGLARLLNQILDVLAGL